MKSQKIKSKKGSYEKGVYGALAIFMLSATLITPSTALAAQEELKIRNQELVSVMEEEKLFLSDLDNIIASKYITFDNSSKSFLLSTTINAEMPLEKISIVKQQLVATNKYILMARKDSSTNTVAVSPDGEESLVKRALLKGAGVNSIKFHWNYARVKLSKNTVRNIGRGLTLGGIWIPHAVVSKVCATLGVGISSVKHGIWFDYNYFSNLILHKYGWQ